MRMRCCAVLRWMKSSRSSITRVTTSAWGPTFGEQFELFRAGMTIRGLAEDRCGINIGQNESSQSNERKHEASASVRLVNRHGDVIWSTTQESGGAKFKSASADVADKIFRKLTDDLQRARAAASASSVSAATHAGIPER